MKPRPEVEWFAEEMENKLRRRDERWGGNGWKEDRLGPLLDRLIEEADELRETIIKLGAEEIKRTGNTNGPLWMSLTNAQSRRIIREAADVVEAASELLDKGIITDLIGKSYTAEHESLAKLDGDRKRLSTAVSALQRRLPGEGGR